jgi:hypothetical protein
MGTNVYPFFSRLKGIVHRDEYLDERGVVP